jgi:hypothetical protein
MLALRRGARPSFAPGAWITAVVGTGVFFVAYDDGGYSLAARSTIAIVVWWTIVAGLALGAWPLERVTRGAIVTGSLLALFAGWDLASTTWAASSEGAVAEFDRSALYLGIYVLAVVAVERRRLQAWLDGLTVAIVAIGAVALVSRLFPGSFPNRGLPAELPSSSTRLSFPLDYWNGLGLFVAIAVPLLLHNALDGSRARRMAAVGVIPALGAVVYLTSSRGAALAAAAGSLVFVFLQQRRWPAFALAVAGAAGSGASVAVLGSRRTIVDGPLESAKAHAEGRQATGLIVLVCILTACVVEVGTIVAARTPALARKPRRLWVGVLVGLALGACAYEARSLRHFTRVPDLAVSSTTGGHLLSGNGSGRWQFWKAAFDEFENHPLHGGGAGSFADWWAQHASFPYFVQNAHSLFLQTLGELGIVGFLLLVGAFASGIATATRRLPHAGTAEQASIAALLGAFTAYAIGAAVDWMWELTAVTVVGVAVLGLLTGPATLPDRTAPSPRRLVSAIAIVLAGLAIVVLEVVPLLGQVEVSASQADIRAGRTGPARAHAVAATKIEPWAASPYLQLALVEEAAGRLAAARRAVTQSIRRDRDDWRPWYAASRIEARLGDGGLARHDLLRARALNPRSPLLAAAS